jgi:hypothetical protein
MGLFEYHNETGLLAPTGEVASETCLGSAEDRVMLAGVCVDIDALNLTDGPGFGAAAKVAFVGEWQVASRITVADTEVPHCQPACFGDAVPQVTYRAWGASAPVCFDFGVVGVLPAVAEDVVCPDSWIVCHEANGSRHDIEINPDAWPSHKEQGDTFGACA